MVEGEAVKGTVGAKKVGDGVGSKVDSEGEDESLPESEDDDKNVEEDEDEDVVRIGSEGTGSRRRIWRDSRETRDAFRLAWNEDSEVDEERLEEDIARSPCRLG